MKRLLLLRHAKSSWEDASLSDFERPLNGRGRRAAPLVGRFMRGKGLRPDLVISSPAERARQTAALVLESAGIELEPRFDARIYEASVPSLLSIVSGIEDDKEDVLLVGHNPGFEGLLEHLTGESLRMPTGALARVTLDAENWAEAARPNGHGRLEWLVKPKELDKD